MKFRHTILAIIIFLSYVSLAQSSEYLMTFTKLSGGSDGEYTMTTTDGSFWESNNPVRNSSYNYRIDGIFDGQHPKPSYDYEWLATIVNGSVSTAWLSVTFTSPVYITKIRTYPNGGNTVHWASSYLSVSLDGTNYIQKGIVDAQPSLGTADYNEYYVDIDVNEYITSIKYNFYESAASHYVVLPEAEFYADDNPISVPEPATLLLGAVALITRITIRMIRS